MVFSDLSQDDILRQTPNLVRFDSPVASFAPLCDGCRPAATFPPSLASLRIAPHWKSWIAQLDSDDEDDDESVLPYIPPGEIQQLLASVPSNLTSLTIAKTHITAPSSSTMICPLRHLTTVSFEMTTSTCGLLSWLTTPAIANQSLKVLKVWCCWNISDDELFGFLRRCGPNLEDLTFKPQPLSPGSAKFPPLRLIRCAQAWSHYPFPSLSHL